MAYTYWDELQPNSFGERLELCTAEEDNDPAQFYVEDILRVINQSGCDSIGKRMATFWGRRLQVWAGFNNGNTELTGQAIIALQCPPFYPPYTFPGEEVTEALKPDGFPS
ncbi:MAG: hypothetical protein KDC61_08455 [Saprospiraceae bacterium]|nr:hypothetical protein [Saprospiraceae bacterium]